MAKKPSALDTFVGFCSQLRLENGEALVVEPFQRTLLGDYFNGVRETLILLPKKNGKTTLLASLAIFHLISTREAECVIGATSREQASLLYRQAAGFVSRNPALQQLIRVQAGYRRLYSERDGGRVQVLAADVDTADGVIPTLALVDELHRAKSADLYGIFRDGLGPRRGQMLTISSAGEFEMSPLGLMRAAARRLPGETKGRYTHALSPDGSFALHEWSLEPTDNTDDMKIVKLANPSSWQTEEELSLRHSSPSMLPQHWLRFACGLWIGGESWWINGDAWRAAGTGDMIEPGEEIALGFDGSRYGDSTALVACRIEDGFLQPLALWEAPRGVSHWEVPGADVDRAIAAAFEEFKVVRAYFDPPLWQTEIDGWAREFGSGVMRYPTNRGRFQAAAERFRTDVVAGTLTHDNDDRMTRHVLSATIREARGGYWLEKSSGEKIDMAIAAVLAYEARSDYVSEGPTRQRSRVPISL